MFKFSKVEESRANKIFLQLDFAGGDADSDHPESEEFVGIKFSEYQNHLPQIQARIDQYKILKQILGQHNPKYEQIKDKYGDEIANLFDNTPNDPQADYQFKCYLSSIILIGYDEQCNKYQAYV